jgi:hypothetical protein
MKRSRSPKRHSREAQGFIGGVLRNFVRQNDPDGKGGTQELSSEPWLKSIPIRNGWWIAGSGTLSGTGEH